MIDTNDLKVTLADVTEILLEQKIRFHLTGGFASSFYGEPRFTQDIDIVIKISVGSTTEQFLSELEHKFIIDRKTIEEAILRKSLFQALHKETMIKVDFHVGEAIQGELDRSNREEILPGITIPLVSKEDAILSKLLWTKKGSHKSRQDIKMMIRREGKLDLAYIEKLAKELGIQNILDELRLELKIEQLE